MAKAPDAIKIAVAGSGKPNEANPTTTNKMRYL
jgi:hypothetical protein